jgi:nitronate monooxygenase
MTEAENKKLYVESMKMDEGWGDKGRMMTYAGIGVGLIHRVMPAGEIVKEVLGDVRGYLARLGSKNVRTALGKFET